MQRILIKFFLDQIIIYRTTGSVYTPRMIPQKQQVLLFPEYAREQRICIQPRPSRASRKRRLKRGKGFFASLSKQRTGLQQSLSLHAVPKLPTYKSLIIINTNHSFPECARKQRICTQPRPSRASRKRRLKKGKGFFASLSKQRTGLQQSLSLHAVPKLPNQGQGQGQGLLLSLILK